MDTNILTGGTNELHEIKKCLIDLENFETQKKTLDSAEKKLSKEVKSKEKAIKDEIYKTIKERKGHIESTYKKPIGEAKSKVKKVQSKKGNTKKQAVADRINAETEALRLEYKDIKANKKLVFRKEGIPAVFNTRLFFTYYLPKGFGDFVIILSSLILVLFIIPCGVYLLWFAEKSYFFLALFYIIVIVVFGGIYLLFGKVKLKNIDALKRVRDLNTKLSENRKSQKHIIRQIRHDKDESAYGLDRFNSENKELEQEIDKLSEEKRTALLVFSNEKRVNIANEITRRHQAELDNLKSEYNTTRNRNKLNSDNLIALSTKIANEYEVYLGKDNMSIEKINYLESLITSNRAGTIAEAIEIDKKAST